MISRITFSVSYIGDHVFRYAQREFGGHGKKVILSRRSRMACRGDEGTKRAGIFKEFQRPGTLYASKSMGHLLSIRSIYILRAEGLPGPSGIISCQNLPSVS